MAARKVHGGQIEIPTGDAIGFKHDADAAFEREYGPERAAKERAAYIEARRCVCGSAYPERWGTRYCHSSPCPRAGKRF